MAGILKNWNEKLRGKNCISRVQWFYRSVVKNLLDVWELQKSSWIKFTLRPIKRYFINWLKNFEFFSENECLLDHINGSTRSGSALQKMRLRRRKKISHWGSRHEKYELCRKIYIFQGFESVRICFLQKI